MLKYEVTVASNMVNEANNFLEQMEEALAKEFGEEIKKHFPGGSFKSYRGGGDFTGDDKDLDLETMIIKEGKKNKERGVFLEGMEIVKQNHDGKHQNETNHNKMHTEIGSNESGSSMSGMSGMSTLSKTMRDTNMAVQWDVNIVGKEQTPETMKKAEIEKMKQHVVKYNLQLTEVKEWIEENLKWDGGLKY